MFYSPPDDDLQALCGPPLLSFLSSLSWRTPHVLILLQRFYHHALFLGLSHFFGLPCLDSWAHNPLWFPVMLRLNLPRPFLKS